MQHDPNYQDPELAGPDYKVDAASINTEQMFVDSRTAVAQAIKVIYGDREATYGDPGKNLRVIAEYWNTHLKAKYDYKGGLTAEDVCVMMILLKQARLANSPQHRDSVVDTIGYAALYDRITDLK